MSAAMAVLGMIGAPVAQAAYPVIDVAAIKHLVEQLGYWKDQLDAMDKELDQLRETHSALTGPRGMEHLLALTDEQRNYVPGSWAEVGAMLEGDSARYAALAGEVAALTETRAVLTDEALAGLTEGEREGVLEARRQAAGLAVMTRQAYAQAGRRFGELASLVSAIGTAGDAKAMADLQGRIAAEQAMLANEQAKLSALYQAAEADRWLREAQLRERAVAGHGQFASRLRPELP
jgi:type IV secretion system protein VirB5